jgi:chemotaxis protein CheZ
MQHSNPNLSLIMALKNHIFDESLAAKNENVTEFANSLNTFLSSLIVQESKPDEETNKTATATLCHDLYSQIGKLTRKIHNSLDGFNKDLSPGIGRLLNDDIPNTSGKIKYIINLTEESATKVINLAEKQIEDIAAQQSNITDIVNKLDENNSSSALATVAKDLKVNLESQNQLCSSVRDSAIQIITSQEFQDLSGQVLKKVTTLIEEVESNLVQIVKMFSEEGHEQVAKPKNEKEEIKLTGPGDNGCSQDEVNDLLASLGF